MQLSDRTFGVEIECGHPKYNRNANDFAPLMKAAGFNCESDYSAIMQRRQFGGGDYGPQSNNWYKRITIGHDGSGLEVRTPILKGNKGLKAFQDLMQWLKDQECYTGSRDGMHVHHGCPELVDNLKLIGELAEAWYVNQKFIHSFVAPSRRANGACSKLSKPVVDNIKRGALPRGELYFGPVRNGHLEIRLHEGTLNIEKATAWILFGQRFIDRVVVDKKSPKGYALNANNFLKNLGIEKEHREALIGRSG